jgi:hypothetical protein
MQEIHQYSQKLLSVLENEGIKIYLMKPYEAPLAEKRIRQEVLQLLYNGALRWNNLPHEAKIAESLSSFKSILKQRMS